MFSQNSSRLLRNRVVSVFAAVGLAAAIYAVWSFACAGSSTVYAQQDPFLTQRINMIEQRFNTIESRLNRLESDSRYSSMASKGTPQPDPQIGLIRAELDQLRLRVSEDECGLVRLDERTLSANAKAARAKSGLPSPDPCRLEPTLPLRLSARSQ